MSVALVPNRFVTATNLDPESINDNLEAIAGDTQHNLDKRYTYSCIRFNLDGVVDTDAAALRQLAIRQPGSGHCVEVCMVEFFIYAAGTAVWTLSCSDTTWPSITTTAAGATTESTPAISLVPVQVSSSSSDLTFTASASTGSTITAGQIVVHLRCDRGQQGTSHAGYSPTLVNSASSTAGSLLDTELTAAATAVGHDTTNDVDLRADLFMVRGLVSGSSHTWNIPSGVRRVHRVQAYCVSAVGRNLTTTASGTITSISFTTTATGATARATNGADPGAVTTASDAPMTAASDQQISIIDASGAGNHVLDYVIVWWS